MRRVPGLSAFAFVAASAHERLDGDGYHHRASASQLTRIQRVLAAADVYQALVSDRPHRAAHEPAEAASLLRDLGRKGQLDGAAVEDVLAAAGHQRRARPVLPSGLTAREVEVLTLLARGHTTRAIADALVISVKTAEHHVQHIYTKIGVSTRGAAALFAAQQGLALPLR